MYEKSASVEKHFKFIQIRDIMLEKYCVTRAKLLRTKHDFLFKHLYPD